MKAHELMENKENTGGVEGMVRRQLLSFINFDVH